MEKIDPWAENSPKRCRDFQHALKTGRIDNLYAVLQKYFESGYRSIVPCYTVQDTAFVFAEYGTIGLSELMDDPDPNSVLYELSHELSCALFNWNDWYCYLDDYSQGNKHELYFAKLKEEWKIFDQVQEQLAMEVKRQAPACRVIIKIPRIEIKADKDGSLHPVKIPDSEIPVSCDIMPDFIYEFDRVVELSNGKQVVLYKTKKTV